MYLCTLKIIGMTGQKTPTALGTEKIGKLLMQYAIPANYRYDRILTLQHGR